MAFCGVTWLTIMYAWFQMVHSSDLEGEQEMITQIVFYTISGLYFHSIHLNVLRSKPKCIFNL